MHNGGGKLRSVPQKVRLGRHWGDDKEQKEFQPALAEDRPRGGRRDPEVQNALAAERLKGDSAGTERRSNGVERRAGL